MMMMMMMTFPWENIYKPGWRKRLRDGSVTMCLRTTFANRIFMARLDKRVDTYTQKTLTNTAWHIAVQFSTPQRFSDNSILMHFATIECCCVGWWIVNCTTDTIHLCINNTFIYLLAKRLQSIALLAKMVDGFMVLCKITLLNAVRMENMSVCFERNLHKSPF